MACLDTTILVDASRGSPKAKKSARSKMRELIKRREPLATTRFNVAELYVGVARSEDPRAEQKAVRNLLRDLIILEFDDEATWLFGRITAYLWGVGRPAGDMDVLIAATAMAAGHSLVTRNQSHFKNVPQLVVEKY